MNRRTMNRRAMKLSLAGSLALAALVVAMLALAEALGGFVDPGVLLDNPGGIVQAVDPGGLAWEAGVRAGQRVEVVIPADLPGGWSIETSDAAGRHLLTLARTEALLRVSAVAAIAAVLLAVLSLASARTRRRRSELLAMVAFVLAAIPFSLGDRQQIGMGVALVAGLGPVAWICRWRPVRRSYTVGLIGAVAAMGAAWVLLRATYAPAAAPLGHAWAAGTALGAVAMLAIGIGVTTARVLRTVAATRVLDATVLATSAVAAIGLAAIGLPIPLVIVVVLLPMLGYARARTAVARAIDQLLLAELRERASIRATEEERARMSREIHDDPLQALAGVIQRLEGPEPDTAAARESLRNVAARLRGVATELHPPVLDDLGLVPAIEAAARGITPIPVELQIENRTGYGRSERPPAEVELAIYRIIAEAMANAARHSGGRHITVDGRVAAGRIVLDVTDDGVGITDARIEEAMREGRLGLASMRRRAAVIDARLEQGAGPAGGTRVGVRWTA